MAIDYTILHDQELIRLFKEGRVGGGIPIALLEEMGRRFANFDVQTMRFYGGRSAASTKTRVRITKAPHKNRWASFTDEELRQTYQKKHLAGKLSNSIRAEVVRRFGKHALTDLCKNAAEVKRAKKPEIPLIARSDGYITTTYQKQLLNGDVDPNVAAEYKKRFIDKPERRTQRTPASYCDAYVKQLFKAQQAAGQVSPDLAAEYEKRFINRERIQKPRTPRAPRPLGTYSDESIRKKFRDQQAAGEIDDDLAAEYEKRFPPKYVAEHLQSLSDSSLRNLYYNKRRQGKISPELDAELGRRFVNYDPETQSFIGRVDAYQEEKPVVTVATPHKIQLPSDKELSVTVSGDGFYNDIYVNDQKIITHHTGTDVKTFLGGALLGVYGVATDDAAYPQKPMWRLLPQISGFTDFTTAARYMGQHVYVQKIMALPEGDLRIVLSNKAQIILSAQKMQRIGQGQIFKIANEKTK